MPRDERGSCQTEGTAPNLPRASPLARPMEERHVSISTPKRLGALVLLASIAATRIYRSGASTAPSAAASTAASAAPSTAASTAPVDGIGCAVDGGIGGSSHVSLHEGRRPAERRRLDVHLPAALEDGRGLQHQVRRQAQLPVHRIGRWREGAGPRTRSTSAPRTHSSRTRDPARGEGRAGRDPGDLRRGRRRLQPEGPDRRR